MRWVERYGLGLMGWVLFSMLSHLMPDDGPILLQLAWTGGYILGFALFTIPKLLKPERKR